MDINIWICVYIYIYIYGYIYIYICIHTWIISDWAHAPPGPRKLTAPQLSFGSAFLKHDDQICWGQSI